jgi:hypothetical protein
MKPSQTLTLKVLDESKKPLLLSGIYVDLDFYMNGQQRYGFRFGPTNHRGELRIGYQDVEKKRVADSKYNLMDYNTPLDDCDDLVRISIPSMDKLKDAYEWKIKWFADKSSEDAKGWLNAANAKIKADETSVKLHGIETIVSVPCSVV